MPRVAEEAVDKMTEQCIDSVPADCLDVGSCQTPASSPKQSPKSILMPETPLVLDAEEAAVQSTSLFNVFEERLTSLRKADDQRNSVALSLQQLGLDALRRSNTSIESDTHSFHQLEKDSSLRRLLLKRPFTINDGRKQRTGSIDYLHRLKIDNSPRKPSTALGRRATV